MRHAKAVVILSIVLNYVYTQSSVMPGTDSRKNGEGLRLITTTECLHTCGTTGFSSPLCSTSCDTADGCPLQCTEWQGRQPKTLRGRERVALKPTVPRVKATAERQILRHTVVR